MSYPLCDASFDLSFSQSLNTFFGLSQPRAMQSDQQNTNTIAHPDQYYHHDQQHQQYQYHDDDSNSEDDNQDINEVVSSDKMEFHHSDDFNASVHHTAAETSPLAVPPILYSLFENLSAVSSNDSKEFRADGLYKRHAPNLIRLKNVFSTANFYPIYANQYDSEHNIQTIVVEVPIVIIRKSDFQETTAPSFVYSTVIQSQHSIRNLSRTLAEYSLLPTKSSQKLPNYQSADQCDILIVCDWKKGDKQFKSVLNKHYTPAMVRKALIIFDKQIHTPKIRGKCDFRPRADIRAIYSVNENYSNDEIYALLQQNEDHQQIIDGRPCIACHQHKYYLSLTGDYECVHCQRVSFASDFFPSKSSSPIPSLSMISDDELNSSDDEKKIRGKKRRRNDENKPNKRPTPNIPVKPSPSTITSIDNDDATLMYILQQRMHSDNESLIDSVSSSTNSLPDLDGMPSPSIESLAPPVNDNPLDSFYFEPNDPSYLNVNDPLNIIDESF